MSPAGYVVSLMKSSGSRGREGGTSVDEEKMRGVRDWRAKTSSPLTYRWFCLFYCSTSKASRVLGLGRPLSIFGLTSYWQQPFAALPFLPLPILPSLARQGA